MSSICCKSPTRIDYYNIQSRPDIHHMAGINDLDVFATMGTYCIKCGDLCDYIDEQGNEYYTNGIKKSTNEKTSNNTKNSKY